jgi:ATP/maltotriose-dependent transcriptional regulator MalT
MAICHASRVTLIVDGDEPVAALDRLHEEMGVSEASKSADQARTKDLDRGRECYARRAWADAYEALAHADLASPLEGDDLEKLAWSAGLTANDDELLRLMERLHQLKLDAGDGLGAARAAFWLGFRLLGMGEMGRASGWFTRAQRLVESAGDECALRGYLQLPVIYRHMVSGELDGVRGIIHDVIAIAERCEERDLICFARCLEGRLSVRQGRIDEGLALLDEAMVAVTSDELSPFISGLIYCGVIGICQQVYALNRAREWTSALDQWCRAQPQLVSFTGDCLVHRSEIMQLRGAWPEALEEARRAAERPTRAVERGIAADACYQEAEIHRLRGEFAEAEDGYRRASQLGREPQPGLALLRLVQGRHDVAGSAIKRVLDMTPDRLRRAGLLPAYIEIMLALGELDPARAAGTEFEEIAAAMGTDVVAAMAAHARGAISLAEGNAAHAIEPLRRAFEVWQSIGAPYVAARIRVLVGCACHELGDEDGAALELDAAREVFERLGAAPDLARLDSLDSDATVPRPDGLTARELEVLRLVASGKTNKLIAKALHLSEKTVDRHVSNIFMKVKVASRAAATAYAYEHGLIARVQAPHG